MNRDPDDAARTLVDEATKAPGQSLSRLVAESIRHDLHPQRPPDALAQAGRFPDFPLSEDSIDAGGSAEVDGLQHPDSQDPPAA